MGCFQVRYDSRVVNYDIRGFIRLATGLVVIGGDSCSKSREYESWHRILGGNFFTYIFFCKILNMFEKMKIIEKEARVAPFFKKSVTYCFYLYHYLVVLFLNYVLVSAIVIESTYCTFQCLGKKIKTGRYYHRSDGEELSTVHVHVLQFESWCGNF